MGKWDNDGVYRRGTRGVRGQDSSSQSAHSKKSINWGELNLGESKSGAVSKELDLSFHKGEKESPGGLRTEYALEGEDSPWGVGADPQKVEEALLKMAEERAKEKEKEDSFEEASQKEQELPPGEQAIRQLEAMAKAFEEDQEPSPVKSQEDEAKKSASKEPVIESVQEPSKEPALSKESSKEDVTPDFLKATDELYQESEREVARQRQEQEEKREKSQRNLSQGEERTLEEEREIPSKKSSSKKAKVLRPSYRDEADEIQLFARELDDQSAIKVMLAQEEEDDEKIFLEAEEHKEKVTAQDLDFCIELKREEPKEAQEPQASKKERRSEKKSSEKKASERVASGMKALGKKIFDKSQEEEEEEEDLQEELSEKETLSSIEESLAQDRQEREEESEEDEDDDDYEVIMVMTFDKAKKALEEKEESQEIQDLEESQEEEESSAENSEKDGEAESDEEEIQWLDDDDEWDGSDYDLTIMPHFSEEEEEISDSLEDEVFEVEEIPVNRGTGKRRPASAGGAREKRPGSEGQAGKKNTSIRNDSVRSRSEEDAAPKEGARKAQGSQGRPHSASENGRGTLKRDARPKNLRNQVSRPAGVRQAAMEEAAKKKAPLKLKITNLFENTSGFMLGLALLILGTAYCAVAYYYADHFIPGTVINGVECGGLTAYEAENKLADELERYSIQVASRNYEPQTIMGSSIDYKYLSDGEVLSLLKGQNHLAWLPGFLHKTRYTTTKTVSYDRSLLRSQFKSLECAKEENQVSPQNAYVAMQGEKFEIIPESQGCALKLKEAYRLLDQAIISGDDSIDFTSGELYEEPTLFADSPEMFTMLDAFNNYATAKITYTIGTATEVLDGDIIKTWLEFDANGDLVKDADSFDGHIRQYVAQLAGRYDTTDTVREFKATSGRTVSVYGYGYGWMLDQEAEYTQLAEEIRAGKQVTREPNWLAKGNAPAPNDIGNTYIEVDMGVQHMYYYQNGYMIFDSDFVSGNINIEGHATPEGIYTLYAKQSPAILRGEADETGKPEYETEVSYWMPFNGGVGFHDAEWQPYFGGDLYLTNGSHGCINLPIYAAATLYDLIEYNVPIICFY